MGPDPDLLDALLADSGELAAVLGASGELRYLNPAGRRLLGLDGDGALPASALDLVADVDRATLEVDVLAALAPGRSWSGAVHVVAPSGVPVPTRSTFRAPTGFSRKTENP